MREGESIESSAVEWRVGAVFWMALIFTLSSELFAPKFSFDFHSRVIVKW